MQWILIARWWLSMAYTKHNKRSAERTLELIILLFFCVPVLRALQCCSTEFTLCYRRNDDFGMPGAINLWNRFSCISFGLTFCTSCTLYIFFFAQFNRTMELIYEVDMDFCFHIFCAWNLHGATFWWNCSEIWTRAGDVPTRTIVH